MAVLRYGRYVQHPLLLHLPATLWVASFVLDLLSFAQGPTGVRFATLSFFALLVALLCAAVAIPVSIAEYLAIPRRTRPKRIASLQLAVNIGVTLVFLLDFFHRERLGGGLRAPTEVAPRELALSTLGLLLLGAGSGLASAWAARVPRRPALPVRRQPRRAA